MPQSSRGRGGGGATSFVVKSLLCDYTVSDLSRKVKKRLIKTKHKVKVTVMVKILAGLTIFLV